MAVDASANRISHEANRASVLGALIAIKRAEMIVARMRCSKHAGARVWLNLVLMDFPRLREVLFVEFRAFSHNANVYPITSEVFTHSINAFH